MINGNDIDRNGIEWHMVDDYHPTSKLIPIIINTDTSDGQGVHWIVGVIIHSSPNSTHKYEGYIYDPLGAKNNRVTSKGEPIDQYLHRAFEEATGNDHIHFYPYPSQLPTNSLCGWHSIYIATILRDYLKRYPHSSSSDLDKVIETQFGKSADKEDVAVLYRAFGGPKKKKS